MSAKQLVPIEELIDVDGLSVDGRPPAARQIRAALPRGWALADDHRHAYRDARLLFREGWILVVGLLVFGFVGGTFLWGAMPSGWQGFLRFTGLVAVVLFVGGLVGPLITRAVYRK